MILFLLLAVTHGEGFSHQLLHRVRVHSVAVGMATKLTNITSLDMTLCIDSVCMIVRHIRNLINKKKNLCLNDNNYPRRALLLTHNTRYNKL
jgi:hypothetical protein